MRKVFSETYLQNLNTARLDSDIWSDYPNSHYASVITNLEHNVLGPAGAHNIEKLTDKNATDHFRILVDLIVEDGSVHRMLTIRSQ